MTHLVKNWHIIYYRTLGELRAESSNSFAGYIWWVLQPLLALAVYYVAFNWLIPHTQSNFALFLYVGITVWQFWAGTVARAAGSLIVHRPLMLQLNIAKYVFPTTATLVNLVKFFVALLLLIGMAFFIGGSPGISMLTLPLLVAELLFLTWSAGILVAAITPFFPDLQWLIEFFLHLMIFLSGVFFDLAILPEEVRTILSYNPIATIIAQFRLVLISGTWPSPGTFLMPLAFGGLMTAIGLWILFKFDKKYPRMT